MEFCVLKVEDVMEFCVLKFEDAMEFCLLIVEDVMEFSEVCLETIYIQVDRHKLLLLLMPICNCNQQC